MLIVLLCSFLTYATFSVMLAIIWNNDGQLKAWKILGLLFLSFMIAYIAGRILGIEKDTATPDVVYLLIWGVWSVGLLMYNLAHGYISKF